MSNPSPTPEPLAPGTLDERAPALSGGTPGDPLPILLSLPETAAILGIHRSTAYDLVRRGLFPIQTLRVGKQIRVNKVHLDAYLAGASVAV